MRCHGHMRSCVPARRHVAWCGSHRTHMMSCAYLAHPASDVCKWYIRFDRLDEPVAMVQTNLEFEYAISLLSLNYIIPCVFWCVLQQKMETPTLVEIFSIKPYSSFDDYFSIILCRNWRHKSGLNNCPPLTFARPQVKGVKSRWYMISKGMKWAYEILQTIPCTCGLCGVAITSSWVVEEWNGHESNHLCSSCQVTRGFVINFQNKPLLSSSSNSLRSLNVYTSSPRH
jgi:hypothetical protein